MTSCATSKRSQLSQLRQLANRKYEMEMAFSRGLFTGWFGGTNNQELVHARFGKKRGVFLGEVTKVLRDARGRETRSARSNPATAWSSTPASRRKTRKADGFMKSQSRSPKSEVAQLVELRFGHGDIDFSRVHVGDKMWKTNDPELDRRLRQSFAGDAPKFQRPIEMEVHGLAGKPLTLIARDESATSCKVESAMPLAKAEKQPLTEEKLREQLGRLGGTPFKLGELKNFLAGEVMLPVSELNRLRREVVAELEKLRAQPKRWKLNACSSRGNEAHAAIQIQSEPPHVGCHESRIDRPRPQPGATRSRAEMRRDDDLLRV